MKVAKCSELNKLFTHSQAPKNSDPAKNDPLPQVKKRVAVLVLQWKKVDQLHLKKKPFWHSR